MKKYIYYIIPCVALPLVVDICCLLHHMGIVEMNFTILAVALAIVSVVIGNFSPTNKLFDYALPVVSVLGYSCYRFICGFYAETDLGTRFSIFEAIEWVFVDTSLLLYAIIAVTTFLASFKYIRIINIINILKHNKKC